MKLGFLNQILNFKFMFHSIKDRSENIVLCEKWLDAITLVEIYLTAKNTVISPNFLVWKLCLSTKFLHQEIRWNYGIFHSASFREAVKKNPTSVSFSFKTIYRFSAALVKFQKVYFWLISLTWCAIFDHINWSRSFFD